MSDAPPQRDAADGGGEPVVAAVLSGELRCAACRYDLRGLSVLERCPECGLKIATSILAVVDPRAQEFEPVRRPSAIAAGLMAWAAGACLAALAAWVLRLAEAPELLGSAGWLDRPSQQRIALVGAGCVLLSGVGALALVRPTSGLKAWSVACAVLGVLLFLPLAASYWWLHGELDAMTTSPYFGHAPDAGRALARGTEMLLIAAIVLLLRRHARALAVRSALLRSGRVDRQTMYAIAAAAAVGIAGDAVRLGGRELGGGPGDALVIAGISIVAVSSALLTLGIVGATIDCLRIARALLRSGRRLASYVSMVEPPAPVA
ncbi:MAG: hypothetical protein AAFX79_07270 [Planctomycetota bacterium]